MLLGKPATVNLTATNPAGQPYGYNLSFRDVLQAGVAYVPASATFAGAPVEPTVIKDQPAVGQTTLIWRNVGDLSPSSNGTLSYQLAHDTTGPNAFTIGGSYTQPTTGDVAAFINDDPRRVPAFTTAGAPNGNATGTASGNYTTKIAAVAITVGEDSPEGEILRGAHDNQRVFTLHLDNNAVSPTGSLAVEAYLPAGLEFLGCGDADNSAGEEYPGSGSLKNHTAAPAGCLTPTSVTTETTDPDGTGPLPTAVYTHVTWSGLGSLVINGMKDLRYLAAVPLRENTAPFTAAKQTANLDNNKGPRTEDEQSLTTFAKVTGKFNDLTDTAADDSATRTAEDLRIVKTADQHAIATGLLTRWSLAVDTGEYRYVDNLRVTDTVPDGLCPLDTTNLESDATADCAPGPAPSAPYTTTKENADGTWTLTWNQATDAALVRMQPSSTHVIRFSTRTRTAYQENGADEKAILARDTWTNSVSVLGADYQRCVTSPDCSTSTTKVDAGTLPAETDPDGTDDGDVSSDTQTAGSPQIDKKIRASGSAVPVDCSGGTYGDAPTAVYGPGDRVCYLLRVDFPGLVNTGAPRVTDFLPPGVTYESYRKTTNNTVTIANVNGAPMLAPQVGDTTVTWTLGNGASNAQNGEVFEVLVAARVTDPTAGDADDVKGNLMKFSFANSKGQSFPLRDQADLTWAEPKLSLLEGVNAVNGGAVNPPNTDDVLVDGGDRVGIRVDVSNAGNVDAVNTRVLEKLPASLGVTCATIVSISDGGTCANGVITWTGVTVPAKGSATLTYRYDLPADQPPGTSFPHHAGVASYQATDNTGGAFTYYPASNVDPAVTAGQVNTDAADDVTNVRTGAPAVTHTSDSTELPAQTGDDGTQATIGERITYTATATVPAGTVLPGASTFTIPLGARQTLDGTPVVTLNTAPLPGGFAVTTTGNTITVTFPNGYANAAGSGADVLKVVYRATLDNVAGNVRTANQVLTTTATLGYTDASNTARTLGANAIQTVVEPNLVVAKTSPSSKVAAGDTITYTLTVTDPTTPGNVSAANDTALVDNVPVGITPLKPDGVTPVSDGDSVIAGNGTWNASARTLTFATGTTLPGGQTLLSYKAKVDSPAVGNTAKTNTVNATTTSYPGTAPGTERTSAFGLAYYKATASKTVTLTGASLTKTVDSASATIAESRTFTLDVTVPNTDLYDVTVRDLLPNGLTLEPGSFTSTCVGGCGLSATLLPPVSKADGSTQLAFFVGDSTGAGASRVVRITYKAHVDAQYRSTGTNVLKGNTLKNSANVYSDRTDKLGTPTSDPGTTFDDNGGTAKTVTVTVVEPTITIDKNVGGQVADTDYRTAQPGTTLTYTLAVKNTGTSPAYDVVVADQPDSELVSVQTAAGVSTTALTKSWSAADRSIRWSIPTIATGATVTLTYTATLAPSGSLREADQAVNTADVPTYFGRLTADRVYDFRTYGAGAFDVVADTVTVDVDLPKLAVNLTTGGTGFPESASAEVGQSFPWRALISNTSPTADAKNVDVTVKLPKNWTYDAGSAKLDGVLLGDPTVVGDTLVWTNITDLAAGASKAVTFTATPSLAAKTDAGVGPANPHIAYASVTGDDATGASASADGPYAAGPDPAQAVLLAPTLTIAKTPDNGTVSAGNTATWSILVGNTGTGTARVVRVTDTLPAGVTYTAGTATSANAGFSEVSNVLNGDGTRTLVFALGNLAPNGTATVTLPVAVPATDADGTSYVNTASVKATEQPDGPSDTGSFTVNTRADVQVKKTADSSSFVAGQDVSWTIETSNAGPSVARGVTMSDPVPATVTGITLAGADAGSCSVSAQTVTCTFGSLAPTAKRVVVVRGRLSASATGSLLNTTTASTTTTDPVAGNNTSPATTPIAERADVAITKVADPTTVVQGQNVTYTLKVSNSGPSDARTVKITDPLPAGMTYVSDDSGCTAASGTVTCALGTIANGDSRTVKLVVKDVTTGAKHNVASVTTTATDPDLSNNAAPADVAVDPAADLAIDKTGDATVSAGGIITYALKATDNGPSDATGVVVADPLPTGTTFVSVTAAGWSCTTPAVGDAGTVKCTRTNLAALTSATITLKVRASFGAAAGSITNVATIRGDQTDPVPANDTDDAVTTVGSASDLTVKKTADPTSVRQTDSVTYTLTTTNRGGQDDTNVKIVDTLPSGVTYVSGDAGCTHAAGVVTCLLGALGANKDKTVKIVVTANAVGTLDNVATVSGDNPDPDATNDTDHASITVAPSIDLTLKKTGPATVAAGDTAVFTLVAHNNGPADATGVKVTDTLPTGLAYVSDDAGCTAANADVTCSVGGLVKGADATIHVTVRAAYAAADQTLTNRGAVTADQAELVPGDNADSADIAVGPAADLSVVKTVDPAAIRQGETATYTLAVHNAGPSAATAVQLTDALPNGVAFVTADPSCTQAAGTVTCALGTLAAGADRAIKVTVRGTDNGVHTNKVTVSSPTPDPDADDNASQADLAVGPTANLKVVKTAPATVGIGRSVTYQLEVSNTGPSDATNATLVDTLPAGLTFESATEEQGSHAVSGQKVTFDLGRIGVDQTVHATVTAKAGFAAAGTTIINSATAGADEFDADPTDNTGSAPVTVGPAADLSIVKTAPAQVPAGGTVVYTLQVANAGPQGATGVTVSDPLPDGLTYSSAAPTQGTCDFAAGTVTCDLGAIDAKGGAQIVVAAVAAADRAGSDIRNVATVTGDQPDPTENDNTDDAVTSVVAVPVVTPPPGPDTSTPPPAPAQSDLRIKKTADPGAVTVGEPHGFTITVTNASDHASKGVVAVDQPADAMRIVAMRPSQGTCGIAAKRCEMGDIAAGATATVKVIAVPLKAGGVTNTASVLSDSGENGVLDNVDSSKVRARAPRTRFRMRKRAARRTVRAGATLRYALTARNVGGHTATGVRVCDIPPRGLTFVRVSGARLSRGRACWTVATWKAGRRRTFRVLARVNRTMRGRLVNHAVLSAANAGGRRAAAAVRVRPAAIRGGGVTG